MWTFASVIVIALLVLYALKTLTPYLDRALSLAQQGLDIERQAVLKPANIDADPIPQFMVEWAMNESTEWAREDKLRRMRELYDRLRDWRKVQQAIAAEESIPETTTY